MFNKVFFVIACLLCIAVAEAKLKVHAENLGGKSAAEWQGRRIYQLLTDRFGGTDAPCNPGDSVYCGGTFKGIEDHLDYIQGMGFNAIWISPVPVNYKEGYHGYWATDFFKINPHFGGPTELLSMIQAAHTKGIWVMIDVVVNHVGPVGSDFSQVSPFNETHHYHSDCAVTQYDCNSEMVHKCRLANLPDLNQTVPFVKQQLTKYVQWLMNTFGFDGIRADTVMYIEQSYWADLSSAVGSYIVGEVYSSFQCNDAYCKYGIDGTLNYPLYYTLRSVYQNGGSMRELGDYWRQQLTLPQPNWEVNFVDNHDNNRFLNQSNNIANYKSAIAHLFFTNGIPCIYYGTEQYFSGGIDGNYCREALWPTKYNTQTHMYQFLTGLNDIYDSFKPQNYEVQERWQDESMYCFIRGPLLVCATNNNQEETRTLEELPFSGMKMVNYFNPQQSWPGAKSMSITVPANQSPLILVGYNNNNA